MKIFYGKYNPVNISFILERGVPLYIPASDDERWKIFGFDPESHILKEIYIIDDYGKKYTFTNQTSFSINKDENNKYIIDKSA